MSERRLQAQIEARIDEPGGFIQIVLGPRQVGKTTALLGALRNRGKYESADSPSPLPVRLISQWWDEARGTDARILAIDEIQKIPGWSEEVKRLWDLDRRSPQAALRKVILTGSSALLMEKGLRESLAGRFELIRAEHWNFAEARALFGRSMESFIEYGCYPGAETLISDTERWGAYIRDAILEPTLGRDLLQLFPVENPALLREVFGVAAALPAHTISFQKIQGQIQLKGAVATIAHYLKLLGGAFIVSGIQKYNAQPFQTRQSSPKLIIHDNALLRAMERPITRTLERERLGYYFENAVGARLIEAGWETYYWRDRAEEVDFVAIGPNGERWAIEVKLSTPPERDVRALQKFCSSNPSFSPHLVTLEPGRVSGVEVHSAEEILSLSRGHVAIEGRQLEGHL